MACWVNGVYIVSVTCWDAVL